MENNNCSICKGRKKSMMYIGIILALIAMLFYKKCNPDTEKIPVFIKVPEIINNFDTIYLPGEVKDTIVYKYKYKDREIEVENPINEELWKRYLNDSLNRTAMFEDAIQERKYENTFEDEYIKIDTYNKTQGRLLESTLKYKIKERTVSTDIEVPKSVKFYYGAKLNAPTSIFNGNEGLKSISIEGLGGIKLKNDDIIIGSFNPLDSPMKVGVGYMKSF